MALKKCRCKLQSKRTCKLCTAPSLIHNVVQREGDSLTHQTKKPSETKGKGTAHCWISMEGESEKQIEWIPLLGCPTLIAKEIGSQIITEKSLL